MSDSDKYETPTPGEGDKAYSLVRAAVGSIPVVGNAAVELLSALYTPPLERRRMQWMEEIANSLRVLDENRQISLNDLRSNDTFITTLVQASDVAIKNHQQDKIQALRNAVLNSALGVNIDDDMQLTFIRYINELTPSHFILLTFFQNNEEKFERIESYEELFQVFAVYRPNANMQREVFKLLCADLIARVLLRVSPNVEDFNDIGAHDYIVADGNSNERKPLLRVTDIGKKLLEFITSSDKAQFNSAMRTTT